MVAKVRPKTTRLCIICNRVKANTLSFRSLQRFLDVMKIPVIAELRETQNYIKASESGLGIHEPGAQASARDLEDWRQIIDYLDAPDMRTTLKLVDNS